MSIYTSETLNLRDALVSKNMNCETNPKGWTTKSYYDLENGDGKSGDTQLNELASGDNFDVDEFFVLGDIPTSLLPVYATVLRKIFSIQSLRIEASNSMDIPDIMDILLDIRAGNPDAFISIRPREYTKDVLADQEHGFDGLILDTDDLDCDDTWIMLNFDHLMWQNIKELHVYGSLDTQIKTLIFERLIANSTLRVLIMDSLELSSVKSLKNISSTTLSVVSARNASVNNEVCDGDDDLLSYLLSPRFIDTMLRSKTGVEMIDVSFVEDKTQNTYTNFVRNYNSGAYGGIELIREES